MALAPGPSCRGENEPEHLRELEAWLKSYKPEELFDAQGASVPELAALSPGRGRRRAPTARERRALLRDLRLPRPTRTTRWGCRGRDRRRARPRVLGAFLRDVVKENSDNFGSSGPTRQRRTGSRTSSSDGMPPGMQEIEPTDDHLGPDGLVRRSTLRAPLCRGGSRAISSTGRPRALQLLRGVHPHRGLDVQPACRKLAEGDGGDSVAAPYRVAELSAHVAVKLQDHNGFSLLDPGFI